MNHRSFFATIASAFGAKSAPALTLAGVPIYRFSGTAQMRSFTSPVREVLYSGGRGGSYASFLSRSHWYSDPRRPYWLHQVGDAIVLDEPLPNGNALRREHTAALSAELSRREVAS